MLLSTPDLVLALDVDKILASDARILEHLDIVGDVDRSEHVVGAVDKPSEMLIRLQRIYNFFIVPCYYITPFGCLWALFYTFYLSVFRRKGISNGVQTERNLRQRDFWEDYDPGDLEFTSEEPRGGQEIGGCPPTGRAPCLMGPSSVHRPTSSSYIYPRTPKTSREPTKNNFHRRKVLYPRDPILEPSPALRRRGNRPRRASTSTP